MGTDYANYKFTDACLDKTGYSVFVCLCARCQAFGKIAPWVGRVLRQAVGDGKAPAGALNLLIVHFGTQAHDFDRNHVFRSVKKNPRNACKRSGGDNVKVDTLCFE